MSNESSLIFKKDGRISFNRFILKYPSLWNKAASGLYEAFLLYPKDRGDINTQLKDHFKKVASLKLCKYRDGKVPMQDGNKMDDPSYHGYFVMKFVATKRPKIFNVNRKLLSRNDRISCIDNSIVSLKAFIELDDFEEKYIFEMLGLLHIENITPPPPVQFTRIRKLSSDERKEIFNMRESGKGVVEIARHLGVSHSTVQHHLKNRVK